MLQFPKIIFSMKITTRLFGILALLVGLFVMPLSAAAASNTLSPVSYTTTSGTSGGQPVANLAVQDQSGTANDWNKYVEFGGTYAGYRTYTVPGSITPASITALQVLANYQGPAKSTQTWTWKIYNWSTSSWVTLGDNASAPSWGAWMLFTFNAGGTMSNYVSGTSQIWIQVVSNNAADAMDLDYEAVIVTSGTGSTNTPAPATATNTPTRTNTAVGPTATRTNTPAGPTATRTNTSVPPTATNTPVASTATRTNTPVGPTNTPAGTIYNQQATNDGTNVTYSFSYSGTFTYFRVYIDTDQSSATGYNANGIGANYLVENGNLYSHPANDSNWSWTSLGAVTYANAGGAASWTIARSAIGETANPNAANLVFQVESPLTTTGIYIHTYSGGGATSTATNTPLGPTATRTNTPVGPTNTPTRTPTSPAGGSTTVTYSSSTAVITNPERGFDHTNTACESSLFDQATLQSYRSSENISLVLCNFYLSSFKTSPISQAALNTLQTQLNTIRSAGLKVVLRFAYTSTDNQDASLSQIQAHINQLAPIIQSNSDVILVWQAGFIGEWGEWYYTNHFGDTGTITTQQWADRKAVVDAMLAALPSTRMVSLRTPLFMTTMYGSTTVTSGTAFNGSAVARIGQHNDAFLASADDQGTYTNTATDYPWLQAQSTYTVMGGENDGVNSPRTDCTTALQEMGMFHWSYINTDYYPQTITNWNSQGCLVTMKKNLGYRFVLTQGTYPNTATAGGSLNVQISIRNDGYAAPFNPRGRELILRNTSTGTLYRFALASDPRFWLAGTTTTINQTITLTGVPAGSYALLLNLPDPESALSTRPEYSIQLANTGTWEAGTGFNNLLMTITVQ